MTEIARQTAATVVAAMRSDFTEPLARMMDCHRRIERFIGVLNDIVQVGRALAPEHRPSLETALDYFRLAVPRHAADEEDSLFARIRQSRRPGARAIVMEMDALTAEHRIVGPAHEQVERLGRAWLNTGWLDTTDADRLRTLVNSLSAAYASHIGVEDGYVFVVAAQVLSADDLRDIGQEMLRRRRYNPGRVGSRCAERRRAT